MIPDSDARNRAGHLWFHAHIRCREQRKRRDQQHKSRHAERDQRPEAHQHEAGEERAGDPDCRRDRLARADMMAAVLALAECSEIGVIGRPVNGVAGRRHGAEREQCGPRHARRRGSDTASRSCRCRRSPARARRSARRAARQPGGSRGGRAEWMPATPAPAAPARRRAEDKR